MITIGGCASRHLEPDTLLLMEEAGDGGPR